MVPTRSRTVTGLHQHGQDGCGSIFPRRTTAPFYLESCGYSGRKVDGHEAYVLADSGTINRPCNPILTRNLACWCECCDMRNAAGSKSCANQLWRLSRGRGFEDRISLDHRPPERTFYDAVRADAAERANREKQIRTTSICAVTFGTVGPNPKLPPSISALCGKRIVSVAKLQSPNYRI